LKLTVVENCLAKGEAVDDMTLALSMLSPFIVIFDLFTESLPPMTPCLDYLKLENYFS
jgi:hypothetical protein